MRRGAARVSAAGPAADAGACPAAAQPAPVTTRDLTLRVMRHNRRSCPLGAAIPNPALLPAGQAQPRAGAGDAAAGGGHVYDPPPGCEALRVQVARRLVLAGCALTPDQIVTTAAARRRWACACAPLCRPGDTVAIESPIYYGVLQAIEMQGLQALEIPTHPRDGISLDALEHALDQNAVKACVVIPNLQQPASAA